MTDTSSPHDDGRAPVDPLQPDRVARYAEAIRPVYDRHNLATYAKAVLPLADSEQAALVAERDRLKRGGKTLGEIIEKQCRMVLDATGLHDWIDEDGDGDWGAVWDHLCELKPRAESAESERDELRAEVERLRGQVERVRALGDAFADDGLARYGGNIAWHIEEAIANEKGDFPDAADRRIASQRDRAEAVEAKVEAERRYFASGPTWLSATQAAAVELRFRAVLADAPAEQRAEGGA